MVPTLELFLIYGIPLGIAIILHEISHGYMALLLGDETAYRQGRLSLNPLRHVDIMGTILIPLFLFLLKAPVLFGYAKPVPVAFHQLKKPRRDMILVALAGPVTNLLLAFLSLLALRIGFPGIFSQKDLIFKMLVQSVPLNVGLAVFNMVPLPPLDGGRVITGLLPSSLAEWYGKIEPYGFPLLAGMMTLPSLLGFSSNPFNRALDSTIQFFLDFLVKSIEFALP